MKNKDNKKENDVEFTIVPEDDIPDELRTAIDGKKKEAFNMTYADNENLYIVVGYGAQPTGGYSISVTDMYESSTNVFIKTEFKGPAKNENVTQNISYPFIVVMIEYTDKSVEFD